MKVARLFCMWLLALVVVSTGAAFAQNAPAPAVGVMAGLNESYFAASPSGDTSFEPGFVVGAFGVLRRDKGFKIQPEMQVSQRRVQVTTSGVDSIYSTTYLNLTLNTRLNLFKGLYTTQGPQFSIPLTANLEVPGGSADIADNITWDWSLVIGVGKQFGKFGIEGRWDAGFRGIEEVPLFGFVKRNRAITILGIYAIK